MIIVSDTLGTICEVLKYDRIKYLDGAKVHLIAPGDFTSWWTPGVEYEENPGMTELTGIGGDVLKAMKYVLNVTFMVSFARKEFNIKNSTPYGIFARLSTGVSDTAFAVYPVEYPEIIKRNYPLMRININCATQRLGYYTPVERLVNYYGIVTLVSMIIILSMTFVVVIMSNKSKKYSFACFEVLRLLVNASLYSRMNTLPLRIFYSMIFLYFLIVQATFAGNISSFLTKPLERRNVESLKDLTDTKYQTVYASWEAYYFFDDPIFNEDKVKLYPDNDCLDEVLKDASVACVMNEVLLKIHAMNNKSFHMMKQPIGDAWYSIPVRDDWPLKDRVDYLLMRLEQYGLKLIQYNTGMKDLDRILEIAKAREENDDDIPLSLSMLEFAFNILGFGLVCATLCFTIEFLMHRKLSLEMVIEETPSSEENATFGKRNQYRSTIEVSSDED